MRVAALLFCLLMAPLSLCAEDRFYFKDGERVVFLGDSITQAGLYISYIDAHVVAQYPGRHIEFINLGLGSETASGDSEPDHPFPRPCVHTRLDRALAESKPDWIVVCYGMNDGIYYPFGEERFANYVKGMREVIAKASAVGAKVIVMTPPPFDARSRKGPLAPLGEEKYSYKAPYEKYNEVLGQYAGWVMSLDGRVDRVVDIYSSMQKDLDARHEADPKYSSGDGIHPKANGHWVMAETFLKRVKASNVDRPAYVDDPKGSDLFTLVRKRHQALDTAWRNHVGHSRSKPLPEGAFEKALAAGAEQDIEIRALLSR